MYIFQDGRNLPPSDPVPESSKTDSLYMDQGYYNFSDPKKMQLLCKGTVGDFLNIPIANVTQSFPSGVNETPLGVQQGVDSWYVASCFSWGFSDHFLVYVLENIFACCHPCLFYHDSLLVGCNTGKQQNFHFLGCLLAYPSLAALDLVTTRGHLLNVECIFVDEVVHPCLHCRVLIASFSVCGQ